MRQWWRDLAEFARRKHRARLDAAARRVQARSLESFVGRMQEWSTKIAVRLAGTPMGDEAATAATTAASPTGEASRERAMTVPSATMRAGPRAPSDESVLWL